MPPCIQLRIKQKFYRLVQPYPADWCLFITRTDNTKRTSTTPTITIVDELRRAGPFFFLLCCNNAAGFMRPISTDRVSNKTTKTTKTTKTQITMKNKSQF